MSRLILCFLIACAFPAQASEALLIAAAVEQTQKNVSYDGRYMAIAYPGGDVPEHIGVCTDVLIRAYRKIGIDLQQLVHEDMKAHFAKYPSKRIWGLSKPDTNIDHRRVPNLRVFFERHSEALSVTDKPADYKPGNIVTWTLPGNLPHVGIVSDRQNPESGNPLIIHNIGRGPQLEDMLFDYPISGHYRYLSEK